MTWKTEPNEKLTSEKLTTLLNDKQIDIITSELKKFILSEIKLVKSETHIIAKPIENIVSNQIKKKSCFSCLK